MFYTLIGTAKLGGIDPQAYLRYVLERIGDASDYSHRRITAVGRGVNWRRREPTPQGPLAGNVEGPV